MTSKGSVKEQIQTYNFTKAFKEATHPRERMRFLAFIHLQEGKGPTETANIIKVDRGTIHRWIRNFQAKGGEGLRKQGGRGKKPLIRDSEREAFRIAILDLQKGRKGGCITGEGCPSVNGGKIWDQMLIKKCL